MSVKYYQVGGCVRDALLDRKSHDIDFSVEAESFDAMCADIANNGGQIFQVKKEFFTVKAKIPIHGVCDFVYCRKEGPYSDGRRPDWVKPGTIEDDLARRDFTMNAIAQKSEDGFYLDPYNGVRDIKMRIIKPVGNARQKMIEDGLRIIRAIRFSAQLGFVIGDEIDSVLRDRTLMTNLLPQQKKERVRDELEKGFRSNSYGMLKTLMTYPCIANCILVSKEMWLLPTLKKLK